MSNLLLSVVIPTLNEEKYLSDCLESVVFQDYKGPVNVIISDNGSTDDTVKIAKKYKCFVVKGSKKENVASARKKGYKKAKELAKKYKNLEEIIINTDADTILSKNYFQTVVRVFKNKDIQAASGPFVINHKQLPFKKFGKRLNKIHYLLILMELKSPWLLKKIRKNTFLYGANSCLRRSLYEKIGDWDERFEKCEDFALTLKILKNNYQINYINELSAITSLRKFINKKGDINPLNLFDYGFKDPVVRNAFNLARKIYK